MAYNDVRILVVGRGRISNTLLLRCPFSRTVTVHAIIRICFRSHVWEHAGRFSFLFNRNWLRKPTPAEFPLYAAEFPFFRPSPGKRIFSREVVPYLPAVRPTSDARLNFPSYIFIHGELGGRICTYGRIPVSYSITLALLV